MLPENVCRWQLEHSADNKSICLFDLILNVPSTIFQLYRDGSSWVEPVMCLAQGPQRSDAGEARTRGPLVSSQALYHWATALPTTSRDWRLRVNGISLIQWTTLSLFVPFQNCYYKKAELLPSQLFVYINGYYPAIGSLYHHMVCNVPVSCKAYRDRNQLGVWLDSDLIFE